MFVRCVTMKSEENSSQEGEIYVICLLNLWDSDGFR